MLADRIRMGSKTKVGYTVTFMSSSFYETEGYFEYSIDGGNTFINLNQYVVSYELPPVVVEDVKQLVLRGDVTGYYEFYISAWVNGTHISPSPGLDSPYVNENLTEDLDIELYLGM